jgi:glycosyltransferase involved in cell wall biosynthesis
MRKKLAVAGPFPPTENGIADYIAELWPLQQRDFDLIAVISDEAPAPVISGVAIEYVRAADIGSLVKEHSVDFLYHVGNNTDHHFILPLIFKYPGVLVLHDYCLSYLLETASFPLGDRETYRVWAQHDHGAFGTKLADDFLRKGWRGRFMSYALPLNGPILASSTAVITHSRYVQFKCAAGRPGLPVHYVPHHVSPALEQYRSMTRSEARLKLGLPVDAVIITAPGFIAKPKLIDKVMQAFAAVLPDVPNMQLVLAGERKPFEYDVDADIAEKGLQDSVEITGFLSEENFFLHLVASDIVVNLRYPSGGESSGTLSRALGLGRASIVLNYGPMGELPDSIVQKIEFGPNLEQDLETNLRDLALDKNLRVYLEEQSRSYSATYFSAEKSAEKYRQAIQSAEPNLRKKLPPALTLFSRRLSGLKEDGLKVKGAKTALWWQIGAAPYAVDNASMQLLAVDETGQCKELLQSVFGWPEQNITAISPGQLLSGDHPKGSFDYAVMLMPTMPADRLSDKFGEMLVQTVARGAAIVVEAQRISSAITNQPADYFTCLGLSQVRQFSHADIAPEMLSMNELSPENDDQSVWIGVRSSEITTRTRGKTMPNSTLARYAPVSGGWMID